MLKDEKDVMSHGNTLEFATDNQLKQTKRIVEDAITGINYSQIPISKDCSQSVNENGDLLKDELAEAISSILKNFQFTDYGLGKSVFEKKVKIPQEVKIGENVKLQYGREYELKIFPVYNPNYLLPSLERLINFARKQKAIFTNGEDLEIFIKTGFHKDFFENNGKYHLTNVFSVNKKENLRRGDNGAFLIQHIDEVRSGFFGRKLSEIKHGSLESIISWHTHFYLICICEI